VLEVLYHRAKFGGARISPAAGTAKNVEFFVCLFLCLSVCLFVTLLNVRDCAPDLALEYRNDFDTVGWGKVCSCAAVLNFLRLLPTGDTTKCRSPKNGKNWGFPPPEGDRINRSRRNSARMRTPLVCYSTPNLAVIGKSGLVQEPLVQKPPKMSKFAQNCGFWLPEAKKMSTFR